MARLGGISLTDPEGKLTSGAAFLLTKPSKVSETLDVSTSGQVTVLAGNPYVVVCHLDNDPNGFYARGFELTQ